MGSPFQIPAPTKAESFPQRTRNRATGPNPFIDEGWLANSYETGEPFELTVPGKFEEKTVTPRDGSPEYTKTVLTGDAASVVAMIRAAADWHNIGVNVHTEDGKKKGTIRIVYQGKERKQRKEKTEANA